VKQIKALRLSHLLRQPDDLMPALVQHREVSPVRQMKRRERLRRGSSSGSLAKFAAMRRASSLVSRLGLA
jgi:hypothetical protein